MSERYLVVYDYKGEEIKILVEEIWNNDVIDDVSISCNKKYIPWCLDSRSSLDLKFIVENLDFSVIRPTRELTRKDIFDVIFKKIELEEKKIDKKRKEKHEKISKRNLTIYIPFLGKTIDVFVGCHYNANKVWYYCRYGSALLKRISFDDAVFTISDEVNTAKLYLNDKKNDDKSFLTELTNLKGKIGDSIKQKRLKKKYPELY